MASCASSRELFKDGVRAVLHTWPVLQVNTPTSRAPGGQVAEDRTRWTALSDPAGAVPARPGWKVPEAAPGLFIAV